MSIALALALIASTTVRVNEIEDVAQETAVAIGAAMAQAITHATAKPCAVDDPAWPACCVSGDPAFPACTTDSFCAAKIRERSEAEDVVFLGMVGSATLIRLTATRVGRDGQAVQRRVDLPREVVRWDQVLDELAIAMFGKTDAPLVVVQQPLPPPPSGPRVLPWLTMGAGAAAIGVGVIFGQLSVATQREFNDQGVTFDAETTAMADRKRTQAISADILFGVGGAVALTGLGMLLFGGD